MDRIQTFYVSLAYLVIILLIGMVYFFVPGVPKLLPESLGPVPLGVPWFGALGAILLSLGGVFEHHDDWDSTFWPWHVARPLVGASLGIVSVLILQAGILAVGSNPTPIRPSLDVQAVTPTVTGAVPTPTAPAGTPPAAPSSQAPAQPVAVPANLLYYLIAFLVGYREETFRSLIKRLTDVIMMPSDTGKPAPSIATPNPPRAPHNVSTPVVIAGSGFTGTRTVKFGATAATFHVDADGQLTVQTPVVDQPGQVAITVSTAGGSATYYPFDFTPPPAPEPTAAPPPAPAPTERPPAPSEPTETPG